MTNNSCCVCVECHAIRQAVDIGGMYRNRVIGDDGLLVITTGLEEGNQ